MTRRTPRRLAFVPLCLAAIAMLFGEIPATAMSVVEPVPVTDPAQVFFVPSLARPLLRVPIVDPVFGTTITRIGGDTGTSTAPVAGTWGKDARHAYSKQQPWNA